MSFHGEGRGGGGGEGRGGPPRKELRPEDIPDKPYLHATKGPITATSKPTAEVTRKTIGRRPHAQRVASGQDRLGGHSSALIVSSSSWYSTTRLVIQAAAGTSVFALCRSM